MRVAKGHGTENDFVVVPDPNGLLELTPRLVAALCDRRAGVGGDGVLRVVRTAAAEEPGLDGDADWFMDYRNADGSVAEMCGNGVRVFARWLFDAGLATSPVRIATRGGTKTAEDVGDGLVRVDMGVVRVPDGQSVCVSTEAGEWSATPAYAPNPHAVAFVDDLAEVGTLAAVPEVTPADAFPDGVNVEFVVVRGERHVALRVHERGVGETRSCGTGVCAAAVVAARRAGDGAPATWTVDVPGGRLAVGIERDGTVALTGPAVLVASADVDDAWVAAHR